MKLMVQGREAYAYTSGKPFDRTLPCVVFMHGAMKDHGNFTLLSRCLSRTTAGPCWRPICRPT